MKYVIRDREAGNEIEWFNTKEDAEKMLQQYEESDKKEGIYSEDFYEIVEQQNKKAGQKILVSFFIHFYSPVFTDKLNFQPLLGVNIIIYTFLYKKYIFDTRKKLLTGYILCVILLVVGD